MKGIQKKLFLTFFTIVLVIISVLTFIGYQKAIKGMRDVEFQALTEKLNGDIESMKKYVRYYHGEIRYENGTLIDSNGVDLEGNFKMVDSILKDMGDVATIFVKKGNDFVRITTNIENEEGKRAVGTTLDKNGDAYKSIVNKKRYIGEADILGKKHFTAYDPLLDASGNVVGVLFVGVPNEKIEKLIDDFLIDTKIVFFSIGIFFVIISAIITFIVGNNISKPIVVATSYAYAIGNLDISKNIPEYVSKQKDEIGVLGKSLQLITNNLRNFIVNVKTLSDKVTSSSTKLVEGTNQVNVAAEEVASVVEQISYQATDQAKDTENGAKNINELGKIIENNKKDIEILNDSAEMVLNLKDEGIQTVDELTKINNKSNLASKEIYNVITNANKQVEEIKESSFMIKSIAEQTSLLSLNAAIEAARAGEEGRGFAVVAEEIRKLAEESNKFTEEIEEVIDRLSEKTSDSVKTMKDISELLKVQNESVTKTKGKFEGISDSIEKTAKIIEKLNISSKVMETQKDKIIEIIQALSAIAQENASSTQEAAASVQEQTASLSEIRESIIALSKLASEMNQNLMRFKQ